MKLTPLGIEGAWLAESPMLIDERGFFREWFKAEEVLTASGVEFEIQQANISQSQRGVIRGIHYSLVPQGQAKWVTCASGHVLDVIVDLRPRSATFKKVVQVDLRGEEARALLIGTGLGHGFLALEDNSVLTYLLSSPYSPQDEYEINPMDSDLNIDWPLGLVGETGLIISYKDAQAPSLAQRMLDGKLPQ